MVATTEEQPSQAQRLEAEAEAGIGANAQNVDQNGSPVNTENEKAANGGLSPSPSSDAVAGPDKGAPVDEKPQRSKAKVALLMGALCVRSDACQEEVRHTDHSLDGCLPRCVGHGVLAFLNNRTIPQR